jgi:ankyrin repeat protein
MADVDKFEEAIKARESAEAMRLVGETPSLLKSHVSGGITPIALAAYHGAWDLVRAFVELGGINSLSDAVLSGDAEVVAAILGGTNQHLNDHTADGFTPLHLAVFFGKDAIAIDLISRGADVNAWTQNALHNQPLHAALAGNASDEVVEALVAKGADVNGGDWSPLHHAAANGRAKAVTLLLAHGADPKATTSQGKRVVELAAEAGHTELVNLLE